MATATTSQPLPELHNLTLHATTTWMLAFLPRLMVAAVVLGCGLLLVRLFMRGIDRFIADATHVDNSVRSLLDSAMRYALFLLVAIVTLNQLGVQTTSLFAVVGAAGLAIGLALQATLTNIAAGVMLLWLRPFRTGDFVQVANQGIAGHVREVGLFASRLESLDGEEIFAPNAQIWNYRISNFTAGRLHTVEAQLQLPSDVSLETAVAALSTAFEAAPFRAPSYPVQVRVEAISATAITLSLRFRVKNSQMSNALQRLHATVEQALAGPGITLSAPFALSRTSPAADSPMSRSTDLFSGG